MPSTQHASAAAARTTRLGLSHRVWTVAHSASQRTQATEQQQQNQQPTWDFTKYIKPDERTKFSVEQLRFLARKRRFHAGEGPAMPEESTCGCCQGSGTVVCHECKGSGVNDRDVEGIMDNELENIVIANNGVVNVFWYLQKGGPCWYCRGNPDTPCRSCEGTGIANFRTANYNGD